MVRAATIAERSRRDAAGVLVVLLDWLLSLRSRE